MKFAIYIRVSTDMQVEDGYSLDAQERILRDYCKDRKHEVYDVYKDEGISGKSIAKRTDFLRLISDSKNKSFNGVLIWKITRFARNLREMLIVCEDFQKLDISLISYTEAFDSGTSSGRLLRNMLGSVAEFEREVLSENVKLGLRERAIQGNRTCSELLGYDMVPKGDMTINEREAEVVRFIFDSYVKYKNLTEVAQLCREKGYKGKRGGVFCPYNIYIILTRFVYCGYYSFLRQPHKGNFAPIISVEQYNNVQRILTRQGILYGRSRVKNVVLLKQNE